MVGVLEEDVHYEESNAAWEMLWAGEQDLKGKEEQPLGRERKAVRGQAE